MIHNIDPVLVQLGPLSIRYYGVMYALGIISAYLVAQHFFRRKGKPDWILEKLIIWTVIGLVLGAHFGHLLFYEPEAFINNPIRILELGKGLASHGGFVGVILAVWLFTRKNKLNFAEYCDVFAVAGSLVVPFIRLGNFFNSEIIGRKTDSLFGIAFARLPENRNADGTVKAIEELTYRHPSQLYEALLGMIIIAVMIILFKKFYNRVKHGTMFWLFVMMYFSTRFLIEFVKEYQALNAGLTMGQWLSIPLVLLGVVMFIWKKYYRLLPEAEARPRLSDKEWKALMEKHKAEAKKK